MKLITEANFDINNIREDTTEGKRMYIEGIFAQAEVVNGNGRWYPQDVLNETISKYLEEYVARNRAIGEINHPEYPMPNPDNAAIRVTEMHWEGNNCLGKALVLKTDKGRKLQDLIEDGYQGGVSTRALGELKKSKTMKGVNEVQKGLYMTAVDYVSDPSGPSCFVQGVNESLSEWVLDKKGNWIKRAIEENKGEAFEDINPIEREKLIIEAMDKFFKSLKA